MKNVLDDNLIPRQPLRGPIAREVSSMIAGKGVHSLETQPHLLAIGLEVHGRRQRIVPQDIFPW